MLKRVQKSRQYKTVEYSKRKKEGRKNEQQLPVQFPPHSTIHFQSLKMLHVSFGKESRNVFYPPSIKQGLRKKRNIVILPRFLQTYKSFSNRIIIDTLLNEII